TLWPFTEPGGRTSQSAGHLVSITDIRNTKTVGWRACVFGPESGFQRQKPQIQAQKGKAPRRHPNRALNLSRNSVKLRLSAYRASDLLSPHPHSVQHRQPVPTAAGNGLNNALQGKPPTSERPCRAARLIAEPLDQSLGSIECRKPRFHVDQARGIGLTVVLTE